MEDSLKTRLNSFNIQGLISGKKMIGDREGWTVKEMMEMYKAMPKGSVFMTDMSREGFCYNMIIILFLPKHLWKCHNLHLKYLALYQK